MTCRNDGLMDDHLAISGGQAFTGPLNPRKTDVSRGPPGLSGRPGPIRTHRVIRPLNTYYGPSDFKKGFRTVHNVYSYGSQPLHQDKQDGPCESETCRSNLMVHCFYRSLTVWRPKSRTSSIRVTFDDREWPWRAGGTPEKDFRNYASTVWTAAIKFGTLTHVGTWGMLSGSQTLPVARRRRQARPALSFFLGIPRHQTQSDQTWHSNSLRERYVLTVERAARLKEPGHQRTESFGICNTCQHGMT